MRRGTGMQLGKQPNKALECDFLSLSATDLANHLGCAHVTGLEHARALGRIDAPEWLDPTLEVLRERGLAHEAAYLAFLEGEGVDLETIPEEKRRLDDDGRAATADAMKRGVGAIVQAPQRGRSTPMSPRSTG